MTEDPARPAVTIRLFRTVLGIVPLLLLSVLTACSTSIAGFPAPNTTAPPLTTSASFDPLADCGNANATLDSDGNCTEPSATTTAPVPADVVYQIIADCEYNGSSPCPTVNADNVQAALSSWICPNVQLTLKDTNGDVSKARSLIQVLINSGQENLVVNGRLALTALDENLCPGTGS